MGENVKIPLSLLNHTVYFLESINPNNFEQATRWDYDFVLSEFLKKKQSLELREVYAKIVHAKDDDERFNARMLYLQEKRNILS